MKRLVLAAAALAAVIVVPTLASGPAKVALANKNVAVANAVNVSAGAEQPTTLASVDLNKALKHRILVVSGSATTTDPCTFDIVPVVNGLDGASLGLTPAHGDLKFSSAAGLTASATWGLDVDALEVDHPGAILGQPLNVVLQVTNHSFTADPSSFGGSLVVELEKR
jgi:hypothetical protein